MNTLEIHTAVWAAWNELPDPHDSPVKTIAHDLDLDPYVVAFVVYPPPHFGWHPDDEPDLPETEENNS